MKNQDIIALEKDYVMQTYGRFPVAIERGQGATLYDFEGKEYVDFASGIGVNSLGYAYPAWVKAVSDQAGKLAHISNLYYSEPMGTLSKRLCEITGMARVFYCNSGAESNEGAIKLARKYSFDKYGKGRSKIITLQNSFHGRTISTLAATGQDVFHQYFFPFTEDFAYVPANDIDALKAEMTEDTCAVLMELIQGEGGVLPLDPEYVKAVRKLTEEKDVLMMIDEVQTGIGRTGTFFCYMGYGIQPDVVSTAKGLGGGLPLGAIFASKKTEAVLGSGTHATTFGANPICCAGAHAVLDVVANDAFLQEVEKKGAYMREKIEAFGNDTILGVRGKGLMIGVIVPDGMHKELAKKMTEAGVLVLTAGVNAIRLLPPLVISYEEMDKGLAIMKKVFDGGAE